MKRKLAAILTLFITTMLFTSCKNEDVCYTPFLGNILGTTPDMITAEQIDEVTSLLIAGDCSSVNKMMSIPFSKEGFSWRGSLKGWDEQFGTQLGELSVFHHITDLSILYNSNLDDISFLSNMKDLKHLKIHMGSFSDLSPLKSCERLETLELVGIENLTDISVLSELISLKELKISGCAIEDFEPISKLTNLEQLMVVYNQSNIENVESIQNLNRIHTLYLIYPNIDISFLEEANFRPQILSVGGGHLDLSIFEKITGIDLLNIEEAVIDDISPLSKGKLSNITLYNCDIASDVNSLSETIKISNGLSHYDFFWLLD